MITLMLILMIVFVPGARGILWRFCLNVLALLGLAVVISRQNTPSRRGL